MVLKKLNIPPFDLTIDIPIIGRVRVCLELIHQQKLKGKRIVDVGSSFGWLEEQLQNKGATIVGIDPDKEAIRLAKKKLKKSIKFLVGNALKVPIKNKFADLVLFLDVIEHIPKGTKGQALKEIKRILKRNGLLILSTPNNNIPSNLLDPAWYFGHRHYTKKQLFNLLEKNDFRIILHFVRGNFLSPIYTIWFYLTKKLFNIKHPRSKYLEHISDVSYQTPNGFIEHFIVAKSS